MTPRQLADMSGHSSDPRVKVLVVASVSVVVTDHPVGAADRPGWWVCKQCQSTRLSLGYYDENIRIAGT